MTGINEVSGVDLLTNHYMKYLEEIFYLNFFIQLNWVLDASVIEPKVKINTGTSIIGLCYPTEKQFLMKKLIGITSHLLCNSFMIIPKFTKNKILYIYYIQFHCQNIMHQTSS